MRLLVALMFVGVMGQVTVAADKDEDKAKEARRIIGQSVAIATMITPLRP